MKCFSLLLCWLCLCEESRGKHFCFQRLHDATLIEFCLPDCRVQSDQVWHRVQRQSLTHRLWTHLQEVTKGSLLCQTFYLPNSTFPLSQNQNLFVFIHSSSIAWRVICASLPTCTGTPGIAAIQTILCITGGTATVCMTMRTSRKATRLGPRTFAGIRAARGIGVPGATRSWQSSERDSAMCRTAVCLRRVFRNVTAVSRAQASGKLHEELTKAFLFEMTRNREMWEIRTKEQLLLCGLRLSLK